MRTDLVVVGVVLLVIGAALLFVPLSPQGSQSLTQSSFVDPYEFTITGISITGSIPITLAWTANSTVNVYVAVCANNCSGSGASGTTFYNESGTSGTFHIDVPVGDTVAVGAGTLLGLPSATTITITTALTTVGSILLVLGIVLVIVGVVLRRSSRVPVGAAAA